MKSPQPNNTFEILLRVVVTGLLFFKSESFTTISPHSSRFLLEFGHINTEKYNWRSSLISPILTSKPYSALYATAPPDPITKQDTTIQTDDVSNDINDVKQYHNSLKDGFASLAAFTALALLESERKRHILEKNSASNWLDDESAIYVKQLYDKLELKLADQRSGVDRDEAGMWIRWMKASPSPTIVELTEEFRSAANETLGFEFIQTKLKLTDMASVDDLFARMGLRLILLPSGAELKHSIISPAGSVIYGKLLYGGVNRYRLSSSNNNSARKTSQKTIIKSSVNDRIPAWVQYGGPPRTYEALDMGPAAVLEVTMQPRFTKVSNLFMEDRDMDMSLSRLLWSPHNMFSFQEPTENENIDNQNISMEEDNTAISMSGMDRNQAFEKSFQSSVGGLQPQIQAIVRRVLDGRIIRPAEDDIYNNNSTADNTFDTTMTSISEVALEAEELALLGLSPVKGLLLYGPPGCGKTALAREISRSLKARAPKIVSAPELLDRWVGGSEKLVRELFAPAEAELASVNYDASKSALHVIVIDEIDAVFRTRSTAEDSGESTRSSVVNQILAKLDGVNSIPNVLLIGMTNRRELLDDALLRPGRLEVQIEIPLPNKEGRREILQIHFDALRKRGRLSLPLCHAIDGLPFLAEESNEKIEKENPTGRKRDTLMKVIRNVLPQGIDRYDLAADAVTGGYSGADLAGLVRCAGSIALSRAREDGGGVESLVITLEDVKQALMEISK